MFSRLRIARTGRSFVPDDDLQPHLTPLDEFWFDVNERPETHRPPGVGDVFPDFIAPSTQGQLQFHDWAKGHWVHLFSMPDAFGPVGTSEVLGIAHHALDFDALDVRNIAISPMPRIDLHMWKRELERAFEVSFDLPMIEDQGGELARYCGWQSAKDPGGEVMRKSYIIDPSLRVRLVFEYPRFVGRSISETIRVIEALQTLNDVRDVCIPSDWHEGDALLVRRDVPTQRARQVFGDTVTEVTPFYRRIDF